MYWIVSLLITRVNNDDTPSFLEGVGRGKTGYVCWRALGQNGRFDANRLLGQICLYYVYGVTYPPLAKEGEISYVS
jgi:hypothetical protein